MADEILIFDAAGSNADGSNPGSPLLVGPGTSYGLIPGTEFPAAAQDIQWVGGADVEGEARVAGSRFTNRTLTVKLQMHDPAGTLLAALQAKHAKLAREGGTLKRTLKNGSVRIYDVLAADGWNPSYDFEYWLGDLVTVEMKLPAAPLSRGVEQDLGDNVETTLPALVFSEASVPGDVPATARLVVDNDNVSFDWWGAVTALEDSRSYDITAATGALFYECESRTALGGAATAVGPSGASGSGSNVVRHTALSQRPVAILSTQASGAGAHLTHEGSFRVYLRAQVPTTNTGLVSLSLQYSTGDFTYSSNNPTVTIPSALAGVWVLLDMGPVTIAEGTTRWESRIIANSTVVGDDVDLDCLFLFPGSTHYGVEEAVLTISTPTAFNSRDEFDQAGPVNLNGLASPSGFSWATTGATTDFSVSGGIAGRGTTADTGIHGRLANIGSSMASMVVTLDVNINAGGGVEAGLLLRYVDSSNYATVFLDTNGQALNYRLVIAGSIVASASAEVPYTFTYAAWQSLTAYADGLGNLYCWVNPQSARRSNYPQIVTRLSQLATGGTLQLGKAGIRDFCNSGSSFRAYDNFACWAPTLDAGVYAGQSLEVRSNIVLRENAAGTVLQRPSIYRGSYLRVPPSGAEAHTVRAIVKPLYAFEQADGVRRDDRIDDLSARLFVTPRYLT